MAKLIVEKGADKGKTFKIPKMEEITIGREGTIQFRIADLMASRKHFAIKGTTTGFHLVDLNSLNGTLLNGKRVKLATLNNGDLITVGETLFSFNMEDVRQDELIGKMIGGYRIIDRIGRGGMGIVYKAEQVDLQRTVALKVLSQEGGQKAERIEALLREARAAAQLNHHNIVQVYDVRNIQNVHFFSMEYMPGGSVQEILNREKSLPVKKAVAMILDAARGLEYAHKKGFLHRDIKPDNLMVSESGIAKIGDLGLAKSFADDKEDDGNVVFGTPHYIAPEQIVGKPASIQSDIYSLGATFYRMAVGTTPHNAATVKELLSKKIKEDPQPPHLANVQLSPKISAVIMRMINRNPDQRFKNMEEVIAEVDRAVAAMDSPVKTHASIPTIAAKKPAAEKNPALIFVAAVGIVVLGVVIGLMMSSSNDRDPVPTPPTNGTPKDPPNNIDPAADREELARQLFAKAEDVARRIDKTNVTQIREALSAYAAVIEQGPNTSYATKAKERQKELNGWRLNADAEIELRRLDEDERKAFVETVRAFNTSENMISLDRVEHAAKLYEDFSRSEYQSTPAAKKAVTYAVHIRKWTDLMKKTQQQYMLIARTAADDLKQQRFGDADETLQTFIRNTQQQAPKENLLMSRYTSLLFDDKALRLQTDVRDKAGKAFDALRRDAESLASRNEYEKAREAIQPAIATYRVPALADEAKRLQEDLRAREVKYKDEIARRAADEEKRKEERDLVAYEELCGVKIHSFLAKYDFASAVAALDEIQGALQSPRYRDVVKRRIGQLQTAAVMKETLINALTTSPADKKINPYFKMDGKTEEIPLGSEHAANQRQLGYKLSSGESGKPWEVLFDPPAFVQFIETRWKLNGDEQKQLAILALELGQYEYADKILPADAVHLRKQARDRDYSGSTELDCLLSIDRVGQFLARKEIANATKELEHCRNRHKGTKTFDANRDKLRKLENDIRQAPPEKKNEKRAEINRQDIEVAPTIEKKVANINIQEILKLVNNIPNQWERRIVAGEVYFHLADYAAAMNCLNPVLRLSDNTTKDQPKEFDQLARTYALIVKIHAINGSKDAQRAFEEAARKFGDEAVWRPHKESLQRFLETYPENAREAADLLKALNKNPDNPDDLWALARRYSAMGQTLKAAGFYRTLSIYYPDFPEVRVGECLYRIAGIHLEMKNMATALETYNDLKKNFPDHPKVKNKDEWDSVENNIRRAKDFLDRAGK